MHSDSVDNSVQGMLKGVRCSQLFLLFLSQGALQRPFVQMQIRESMAHRKIILLLHEEDASRGAFNFTKELAEAPEDIRELVKSIESLPWRRRRHERDAVLKEIIARARVAEPRDSTTSDR